MRMKNVVRHEDSYLLEPVQEPLLGWCIRPGTFRVAQPYDKSGQSKLDTLPEFAPHYAESSVDTQEPQQSQCPVVAPPPHKRQKLSKNAISGTHDPEQVTVQWMRSELFSLIDCHNFQSLVRNMQGDYFYGTCVDAPPSDAFSLDLVKLQPVLRMLRSGFASATESTSGKARRRGGGGSASEDDTIVFDELQLDSKLQQLDLGDVYEALVVNNNPDPTLISFPTDGRPRYLIPPRSAFVVSDLDRIHGLKSIARQRGGFDIIVMDPPWQNASVERMAHYSTMDLYDLFKIPIPDLLGSRKDQDGNGPLRSGGIVAVWITNRAKVKKVVLEKLFPAWGLELVAHWFWLKVTTKGEPVLSLDNMHRRPYEGILIGRQRPSHQDTEIDTSTAAAAPVVSRRLLVSIPAQHSRKPSLNALLEEEFFPVEHSSAPEYISCSDAAALNNCGMAARNPLRRLELFARNLEEGVLSWGNEPIRHQYCGHGPNDDEIVQDGYLVPSLPSSV
ncbi:MT-A70-domain-containing protein [Dissophora ornata]|nr:MT-A70-domain-containing protein [Dissophora ornata]